MTVIYIGVNDDDDTKQLPQNGMREKKNPNHCIHHHHNTQRATPQQFLSIQFHSFANLIRYDIYSAVIKYGSNGMTR